ncbi:MAG TPA: hypothetical protein VFU22_25760 [Roseiflexaceae bacterium]|nr:hypothetical protein [Roseiflexaceae bacterium]
MRAIKLYGAAASYRVTPAERIQQEKTFAIVRDRIGAAAFAAAWAAGCALALDQAIAEALHPYQRES